MRRIRHRSVLLATALLLSFVPAGQAQAPGERPLEFAAAVNLATENAKLRAVLLVPANLKRIRAVIWVVHHGQMSEQLYNDAGVRQMAAEAGCGLVLASIQNIQFERPNAPTPDDLARNAALGGDAGLRLVLEKLAQDTSHPELRSAPILFWGFSAAASFGTTFAALHPDRTIAFVRYHTHRRGLPVAFETTRNVPALLLAGGKDTTAGVDDARDLWKVGRAAGAPWAFAIEPDAPHSSLEIHATTLRTLTVPWMAAVLRLRLSDSGSLQRLVSDSAWLADDRTFDVASQSTFRGNPTDVSWLPDARSAQGWQAVVRGLQ
jgi:dienelactone hydrolase